jgi:hypothetical protein
VSAKKNSVAESANSSFANESASYNKNAQASSSEQNNKAASAKSKIDGNLISNGKVGESTKKLMALLYELINRETKTHE